jgi:hypothetical protein
MYVENHTNGALECVLFADDLILLVRALNAYAEDHHTEIDARGNVPAVEGLRQQFELGAHLVELVNGSPLPTEQVKACFQTVRRDFGFYTTEENEGKEAA